MAEDGSEYFFVSEGKEKSFTKEELGKLSPVIIDYLDYFAGMPSPFSLSPSLPHLLRCISLSEGKKRN
jgi:hypothetical protein